MAFLRQVIPDDAPYDEDDDTAFVRQVATDIESCGGSAWLCHDPATSTAIICVYRCKRRCCPHCSIRRARAFAARGAKLMKEMDSKRMLTFTPKSTNAPLKAQLKQLLRWFAALRRTRLWKRYATGGFFTIEITYNCRTLQWHPHIHAIVEGHYFPHEQIKAKWKKITKTSHVVNLKRIDANSSAAKRVSGYVTTAADLLELPTWAITEWVNAVHGVRVFNTFGTFHGRASTIDPPRPRRKLERLIHLTPVRYLAERGDPASIQILAACRILYRDPDAVDHAALIAAARAFSTTEGPSFVAPVVPQEDARLPFPPAPERYSVLAGHDTS